jgi:hypothetical protein
MTLASHSLFLYHEALDRDGVVVLRGLHRAWRHLCMGQAFV